ncbi:GDSL family lipase [Dyella telluris]|uniref:GDSL family lipase n=2 Tax=Dyella telluris TaxID=2763498 RepID=A0A7G8QA70_9GAMM|nr:GDSL family lipase [Dyella telluris]
MPIHAEAPAAAQKWVATWAQAMTSNVSSEAHENGAQTRSEPAAAKGRDGFTVRQAVLTSVGGGKLRIRLSNYFGDAPLTVASAHVALGAPGSSDLTQIVKASDRALRFDGKDSLIIPAGGLSTSDAVELDVPALSTVVVSLHFAEGAHLADVHPMEHGPTTTIVAGNAVDALTLAGRQPFDLPDADNSPHVYVLNGVDVQVPQSTRGIVAFGDSITDGAFATTPATTWPGVLSSLANVAGTPAPMAVANMGISADELTTDQIGNPKAGMSGLKRFERDVIDQPGVTDVLVLLGSNDINRGIDRAGQPNGVLAGDLIAGLRMLTDVAHQHGLRVYVGTVPPFAGLPSPGWFTPEKEAVRQQVNRWIEHDAKLDGVLPFADVLTGRYQPSPLAAAQHPLPPGMATVCAGDAGLHPNDQGYAAMGQAAFDIVMGRPLSPGHRCN